MQIMHRLLLPTEMSRKFCNSFKVVNGTYCMSVPVEFFRAVYLRRTLVNLTSEILADYMMAL